MECQDVEKPVTKYKQERNASQSTKKNAPQHRRKSALLSFNKNVSLLQCLNVLQSMANKSAGMNLAKNAGISPGKCVKLCPTPSAKRYLKKNVPPSLFPTLKL